MYTCEICKRVIGPRVSATRLVMATRKVTYPPKKEAHLIKRDGKTKKKDDPGGSGEQIVQEIVVCPDCAENHRR